MVAPALWVVADAVALAAAVAATVIDQRTRRIPNWLTGGTAALGLVLNVAAGAVAAGPVGAAQAGLAALAGAAFCLVLFGGLAAARLFGMGDAKLMAGLGALLRWPAALPLVLHVALAGGLVSLVHAIRHRRLTGVRIPYAMAIALGCAWTIALRHLR
jgi:prepilin peptidase CpaA